MLGIVTGIFIHYAFLSQITSFGCSYFTSSYKIKPIWKREFRNSILNTKRPTSENTICMKWKYNKQ